MGFIALIRLSVGSVTFCSKMYNWIGSDCVYSLVDFRWERHGLEWISLPLFQVLTTLVSSWEVEMVIGCYGDPPSANLPKFRWSGEDLDDPGNRYTQGFLTSEINVPPKGSRAHRMKWVTASHSGSLSCLGNYGVTWDTKDDFIHFIFSLNLYWENIPIGHHRSSPSCCLHVDSAER